MSELLNKALELSEKIKTMEQNLETFVDFVDFVKHLESDFYIMAYKIKSIVIHNMRSQLNLVEQGFDKEEAQKYFKKTSDFLLNESKFAKTYKILLNLKNLENQSIINLCKSVNLTCERFQKIIDDFSADISQKKYDDMCKKFRFEGERIRHKVNAKHKKTQQNNE